MSLSNNTPFGRTPSRQELKALPPMMLGMLGVGLVFSGLLTIQQAAKMYSSKSYLTPFQRGPNSQRRG